MKKNLIIAVVGEKSLHREWISKNNEYDILLINYSKKNYSKDCNFYLDKAEGSKYNILYENKKYILQLINKYENIFVPDDDILIFPNQIKKIFKIHSNYNLYLSMPSLKGIFEKCDRRYIEDPIMCSQKGTILHYTNWVGIICPCFSSLFFEQCIKTFNYNKSNWGIAFLWCNLVEEEKKIAIIDSVECMHTRRLYQGENYKNNLNYKKCLEELNYLLINNKIKKEFKIYDRVVKVI